MDEQLLAIIGAAAFAYMNLLLAIIDTSRLPFRERRGRGERYTQELLEASDRRFREVAHMEKETFLAILTLMKERQLLRSTKNVTVEEQFMMFLFVTANGNSIRQCGERFQRGNHTVSKYLHKTIAALRALYPDFVHLPDALTVPKEIVDNPKFFPYFRDCIGALDGSHFAAKVNVLDQAPWRNRKGYLSQNVLVSCHFDLTFSYIHAGWEGSAHDTSVLRSAFNDGFSVPEGKYYLADAGYALSKGFLTPYRGVRYHLKESARAGLRPENKEELFNLRHAMLRNAVERIFGVFKKRFKIFQCAPEFKVEVQSDMILALAALHNMIRMHEKIDYEDVQVEEDENVDVDAPIAAENIQGQNEMKALRDEIATAMWHDYQLHIAGRPTSR